MSGETATLIASKAITSRHKPKELTAHEIAEMTTIRNDLRSRLDACGVATLHVAESPESEWVAPMPPIGKA